MFFYYIYAYIYIYIYIRKGTIWDHKSSIRKLFTKMLDFLGVRTISSFGVEQMSNNSFKVCSHMQKSTQNPNPIFEITTYYTKQTNNYIRIFGNNKNSKNEIRYFLYFVIYIYCIFCIFWIFWIFCNFWIFLIFLYIFLDNRRAAISL